MAGNQADAGPKIGFSSEQVKVLGLTGLGGAIELYEFIVFIMLIPYISQAFFPASTPEWVQTLQTRAIIALGYLVRPLGNLHRRARRFGGAHQPAKHCSHDRLSTTGNALSDAMSAAPPRWACLNSPV